MPLHAQIVCIGGNALLAFLFLVAGLIGDKDAVDGDGGFRMLMFALCGMCAYTVWVLLKFRRYLSAEVAMERELHIEQLREEIDRLKANNGDAPPGPTTH